MEAHRVVRHRRSHIFKKIGSQLAVRLSALRAGRPSHPGRFLVLISVKRLGRPQDQLKNSVTSSGIEPAAFRLVA
jgi:hypothetical protein